jgi:hypothetical protein
MQKHENLSYNAMAKIEQFCDEETMAFEERSWGACRPVANRVTNRYCSWLIGGRHNDINTVVATTTTTTAGVAWTRVGRDRGGAQWC